LRSLLSGAGKEGIGRRETFISFAAYCNSPTTSAPSRVSTPITAGTMSQTTQFSVQRKKERISMMAWKPCWGSTM
jgi:hypothetical protein